MIPYYLVLIFNIVTQLPLRELDVDPKVVAEQLGHTLDVNLNIYTDAGFQLRKKAVDILEASLRSSDGVEMEYVN